MISDQEANTADLATGLRNVWENGFAGMEKGSSPLQAVARLFDRVRRIGSPRTQDTL